MIYCLGNALLSTNKLHQGTGDNFYKQGQLLPENLEHAVQDTGLNGLKLRYQEVGIIISLPVHLFTRKALLIHLV